MPRVAARLIPALLLIGGGYIAWLLYKSHRDKGLTTMERRNLTWALILSTAALIGLMLVRIE